MRSSVSGRGGEQTMLAPCWALHILALLHSTREACEGALTLADWGVALVQNLAALTGVWGAELRASSGFKAHGLPIMSDFVWCLAERGREEGGLVGLLN